METSAGRYLDAVAGKLADAARRLPGITEVAETVAVRHLQGGMIGFPGLGSTLEAELFGRSGGLMHIDFARPWTADRTAAEKRWDVILYAWDGAPGPRDLDRVRADRERGLCVIGFGPRRMAALKAHAELCRAWIDTGSADSDAVVDLDGRRAGRTNHFTNAVNGWLFIGELVGALTRWGVMPPMWKSWYTKDGRAWSERYFRKVQFHDDLSVRPVGEGEIGARYLERIGALIARLRRVESGHLGEMAARIAAELRRGRRTIVASAGHMPAAYAGRYDDRLWAVGREIHENVASQMQGWDTTPDGGLVLRLGDWGLHRSIRELFRRKQQRVLLVTGEHPDPEWMVPRDYDVAVDLGARFGDACVPLEGYPIRILPPSGVLQVAAYETINVGVQAREPDGRRERRSGE